MHQSAIATTLILLLLGAYSTDASEFECPAGATSKHQEFNGTRVAMCVEPGGGLHGPAVSWYPSGGLRSRDSWEHGKKSGTWQVFDEQGTLREEKTFERGSLNGPSTYWHANGKPKSTTQFQEGVRHGAVAEWSDAEVQTVSGRFEAGKPAGTWVFYNPTQSVLFSGTYERGENVSTRALSQNSTCETWNSSSLGERLQFLSELGFLALDKYNKAQRGASQFPPTVELGGCIVARTANLATVAEESCESGQTFLSSTLSNQLVGAVDGCRSR